MYYDTSCNSKYDQFKSTKEVITQYGENKEDRITTALTTQSMEWNQLLKFGPDQFQNCQRIFTTFLFDTSITFW